MTASPRIVFLTPHFGIASQLRPADFADLARAGVKTVINNRPDGEDDFAMTSQQAREAARKAGLYYRHVPAASHSLFDDDLLQSFEQALGGMPGPTVAYCKTGTRSAVLWARLAIRCESVEAVLRHLAKRGYDLAYLASELEEEEAALPRFLPGQQAECTALSA